MNLQLVEIQKSIRQEIRTMCRWGSTTSRNSKVYQTRLGPGKTHNIYNQQKFKSLLDGFIEIRGQHIYNQQKFKSLLDISVRSSTFWASTTSRNSKVYQTFGWSKQTCYHLQLVEIQKSIRLRSARRRSGTYLQLVEIQKSIRQQ